MIVTFREMMRFSYKLRLVKKTAEAASWATNSEFNMVLREIATIHPDLELTGRFDRRRPVSNSQRVWNIYDWMSKLTHFNGYRSFS
ncbi:hypothetical protein TIFTF001_020266 [Ficus carica]|uniref:Uncharacterized protein n=1 Tax=Ficus carica TaxID=3494 RepID=A0AA88AXS3_FICCA|nr:hypothetical protein TIFTF001_020266 [Ficus carica]